MRTNTVPANMAGFATLQLFRSMLQAFSCDTIDGLYGDTRPFTLVRLCKQKQTKNVYIIEFYFDQVYRIIASK